MRVLRSTILVALGAGLWAGCICGVDPGATDAGPVDAGSRDGGADAGSPDAGNLPPLSAVWAVSASDVWAVGVDGTATHWDGARWKTAPSFTTANLIRVRGSASNDIWALGLQPDAGSVVFHFDGGSWSDRSPPPGPALHDLWASAAADAFVVGAEGTIWHWSGAAWTKQSGAGTVANLRGLWGAGANDVWAVGNSGAVIRWNGSVWAAGPSPLQTDLLEVSGADATHVWAIGGFGGIFFFNGTTWATEKAETILQSAAGLWALDPANVWTFSRIFTCVMNKRDAAGTWPLVSSPPPECGALGGTSPSDLWVVGNTISHWDGGSWAVVAR